MLDTFLRLGNSVMNIFECTFWSNCLSISQSGMAKSMGMPFLRSSTRSPRLLSRNMPIVLVTCCCVINHHTFSGLKEHTSIISPFLWVRNPGHGLVGSSASVFHKPAIKLSSEAGVSFESSTGAGSESKLTQVVGRIQFLHSWLLRTSIPHWCQLEGHV